MEDAHTHLLAVPDDSRAAFFGVYDGHGGPKVAQYAGTHLHKLIVTDKAYGNLLMKIYCKCCIKLFF